MKNQQYHFQRPFLKSTKIFSITFSKRWKLPKLQISLTYLVSANSQNPFRNIGQSRIIAVWTDFTSKSWSTFDKDDAAPEIAVIKFKPVRVSKAVIKKILEYTNI